jgi:hypothetical protein
MFRTIVFIALMILLILSSGAAFQMGLFKGHLDKTGFVKRALGGVCAYGLSILIWLTLYSHYYLGW